MLGQVDPHRLERFDTLRCGAGSGIAELPAEITLIPLVSNSSSVTCSLSARMRLANASDIADRQVLPLHTNKIRGQQALDDAFVENAGPDDFIFAVALPDNGRGLGKLGRAGVDDQIDFAIEFLAICDASCPARVSTTGPATCERISVATM